MAEESGKKRGIDLNEATSHIRKVRKAHFLGIGIDEYQHFPKLSNAAKDVQDIADILRGQYQFDPDNMVLLFNEQASREGIINALEAMVNTLDGDNDLTIYYSGHGHLNDKTGKGFWIPADAEPGAPAGYIPNTVVKGYIEDIPAFHTFLISDSCFSGSLFVEGKMRSANEAIEDLDSRSSRWALCSGRHDEEVYDGNPGENSPFAQSILQQLKQARSSELNVSRLIEEVIMQTRAHYRQLPEGNPLFDVGHEGGQFIFRLKFDDARDWAAAEAENSVKAYENYLALYPEGQFVREAKQQLLDLNDEAAWSTALEKDTVLAYENYLEQFPKGRHDIEAGSRIKTIKEEQEWAEALRVNEVYGYQSYLEKYPEGRYAGAANQSIEALRRGEAPFVAGSAPAEKADESDTLRIPRGYLIGGILLALAVVVGIFAWVFNGSKKESKLIYDRIIKSEEYGDYMAIQKGKYWGFYNSMTKSLILPQFEEVNPFVKEMALVKRDGKYGWINKQGSPVIRIEFDKASTFNNKGIASVELNGQAFNIDRSGNRLDISSEADEKERQQYESALGSNTIPAYQDYLSAYPAGKFAEDARKNIDIKQKAELATWEQTKYLDRGKLYKKYLQEYPNGKYTREAEEALQRFIMDLRDSLYYRTVTLDDKLWMAQNLNYKGSGLCYYKQDTLCEKTGRLYTWEEAQNACPDGWRLPSDGDWWAMAKQFGGAFSYSKNNKPGAGEGAFKQLTDSGSSGFRAALGGKYAGSAFSQLGKAGYYWTGIRDKSSGEVLTYVFDSENGILSRVTENKDNYFSCRCVRE
ncbi:MAG: caspase family protein [Lewinellaceae bacterium]|nr:caspase family protein [Phaeodactylibacter sp.]MCB9038894.1 caspase family protein [Lewinellaceae bacterium]